MSQDTQAVPADANQEGSGFSEGVQTDPNAQTVPTAPVKAKPESAKPEVGASIDPENAKAKAKPADAAPKAKTAKQDPAGQIVMLRKVKYNGEYYEKGVSYSLDKKAEDMFRSEGFIA